MPNRLVLVSLLVVAPLLAAGCTDVDVGDDTESRTDALHPSRPATELLPPEPFVLAADGVTRLSLEGAEIYQPGGEYWAVVLGKALFWDEQVGSDGVACASCHFHAGADTRLRNQISPGLNDETMGPGGDHEFGSVFSQTGAVSPGQMPSGAVADSNYLLQADDFPLHQLEDETDPNSPIITTTNDRISSQGMYDAAFEDVTFGGFLERCGTADPTVFHAGWRFAARQVEPRNTPSFHNAVFNFRNFWDSRANNLFSGTGTFGLRDVLGDPTDPDDPRNSNRLIILEDGEPTLGYLRVENASLASQAVGPPLSALEMSCNGRSFADVGRKMVHRIPLRTQRVSRYDSVLGPYVSGSGKGLRPELRYASLIRKVFHPKYWALSGRYRIERGELVRDPRGYTQMQINFSMFFGLAVQAFEATQISNRSEFDALQADERLVMTPSFAPVGPAIGGCSADEDVDPLLVRGCTIFARFTPSPFIPTPPDGIRGGNCFVCHNAAGGGGVGLPVQPMLSEASFQEGDPPFPLFLTVGDVNGFNDLRDNGVANIGLRDSMSDLLTGRTDPYGNPLSFGRQYWNHLDGDPDAVLDPPLQRLIDAGLAPSRVGVTDPTPGGTFRKLGADGGGKVPILRNVALTPPYFSWGGYPSLRQVLKVYNRGMNRRDIDAASDWDAHGSACSFGDDTGTGPDGNGSWPVADDDCNTNTTGLIIPLGLSDCDANGAPNAACLARGHTVEDDDLAALERFLKSLTDPSVQCDQAPFDHPELTIADGHLESGNPHTSEARDIVFRLPAVGAHGYSPRSGLCIPNAGDLFAPGMQARSGGPRVPLRSHWW